MSVYCLLCLSTAYSVYLLCLVSDYCLLCSVPVNCVPCLSTVFPACLLSTDHHRSRSTSRRSRPATSLQAPYLTRTETRHRVLRGTRTTMCRGTQLRLSKQLLVVLYFSDIHTNILSKFVILLLFQSRFATSSFLLMGNAERGKVIKNITLLIKLICLLNDSIIYKIMEILCICYNNIIIGLILFVYSCTGIKISQLYNNLFLRTVPHLCTIGIFIVSYISLIFVFLLCSA